MLKKINNQHCLTALTAGGRGGRGGVVPKGPQLGVNSLVLAVRRSGR